MPKNNKSIKRLANFFFEVGVLRKTPRSHQQTLLTQDLSDNIASHSFRTTVIGYFLANELKANTDKVVKMCLLHDLEEARSGDQNWIHKKYIKVFEDEIRQEQLGSLPNNKELLALSKEYDERKTLEAKIAKDADLLDQILLLKEYHHQGNQEAGHWLHLNRKGLNQQEKFLSNNLSRQIAVEIKKQLPSNWWTTNAWSSTRR